jgi:hypothetical protein
LLYDVYILGWNESYGSLVQESMKLKYKSMEQEVELQDQIIVFQFQFGKITEVPNPKRREK